MTSFSKSAAVQAIGRCVVAAVMHVRRERKIGGGVGCRSGHCGALTGGGRGRVSARRREGPEGQQREDETQRQKHTEGSFHEWVSFSALVFKDIHKY